MSKDSYKTKEQVKSEVFGIITTVIVIVGLVLIIVFALTNRTDNSEKEQKESVAVSESVSASEKSTAASAPSGSAAVSGEAVSQNTSAGSAATGTFSLQQELANEQARYEKEKREIDEQYNSQIETNSNVKRLLEQEYSDKMNELDTKITELDIKIASLQNGTGNEAQINECRQEKQGYEKQLNSYRNDIAKIDKEIQTKQTEYNNALAAAEKKHNQNVNNINLKY